MDGQSADVLLLDRTRRGDPQAMRELFVKHSQRIYAMALRITGRRADAEDVVQESFLRAWHSLGRFRGECSFGTWLYRIAFNRCRTLVRNHRRLEPLEEERVASVRGGPDPARRLLTSALARLPEGYRETIVLHDVLGLDHQEIAAILGCSAGTSKSQLHKARARMRELLTQGPSS